MREYEKIAKDVDYLIGKIDYNTEQFDAKSIAIARGLIDRIVKLGKARVTTRVRGAKSKGSQFEYDCQASLEPIYKDIFRTSERGFCLQYDLQSDNYHAVFECKRLKGISWNQCVKYFKKLKSKTPTGYTPYLLFKSNQQPCLVMFETLTKEGEKILSIETFETCFNLPFIKHKSTRAKK